MTSGKLSRWQRRYFVLHGCILRYSNSQATTAKRSFDLRQLKEVRLSKTSPRELELVFGLRLWRLRADTPDTARSWQIILVAASQVADIPAGECIDDMDDENWSDSESRSTISTVDSAQIESAQSWTSRGIAVVTALAGPVQELQAAPEMEETLEVDADNLDRQFAEWIPIADARQAHVDSARVRAGLAHALSALWTSLGAKTASADGAIAALHQRRKDPNVEIVVSEFLSRMRVSISGWLEACEPRAAEVSDITCWVFLDMKPMLESVSTAACGSALNLHEVAKLEQLLLSEWEVRSIAELCMRCEVAYRLPSGTAAELRVRVDEVTEIIQLAKGSASAFPGPGYDRGSSILIAALNATVRAQRMAICSLLAAPASDPAEARAGGAIRRSSSLPALTRQLKSLGGRSFGAPTPAPPPKALVAATVAEAIYLAELCREAHREADHGATGTTEQSVQLRREVLATFRAAFERQASELCGILAETHFVSEHRKVLKGIALDKEGGTLETSCAAASSFLEEIFVLEDISEGAAPLCGALGCRALVGLLVQRWLKAFRRTPRRSASAAVLAVAAAADRAALERLAALWGTSLEAKDTKLDILAPVRELQSMLADPTPDIVAMGTARLEVMLGADSARALGALVRGVAK